MALGWRLDGAGMAQALRNGSYERGEGELGELKRGLSKRRSARVQMRLLATAAVGSDSASSLRCFKEGVILPQLCY